MRDSVNAAIENALGALLPSKRAGQRWERDATGAHTRNVIAAAGSPEAFLAWASAHEQWRFNTAEAPSAFARKPADHAAYVVHSVLEELLERAIKADKKAGR